MTPTPPTKSAPPSLTRARRARAPLAAAAALSTIAAFAVLGAPAGAAPPAPSKPGRGEAQAQSQRERKGAVDVRSGAAGTPLTTTNARSTSRSREADRALQALTRTLGTQLVADMDSLTGTPRNFGRLDGFLTAPSKKSARSVVLGYVRAHAKALGLSTADLSTLTLRRDYVDITGTHHLSWTQSVAGRMVFGNGLKANVSKSGRLISIQGSPVAGLATLVKKAPHSTDLTASAARNAAAADVGGKAVAATRTVKQQGALQTWSNKDRAQAVWFLTPSGLRPAWSTYVQAGGDNLNYQHVVDAGNGRVLYRHDTVNYERGDAKIYKNYPGAKVGGKPTVYNLIKNGLIARSRSHLTGKYVIAWSDVKDNDKIDKGESVGMPGGGDAKGKPQYTLRPFQNASGLCSSSRLCTWNPNRSKSWQRNRSADVTQGFYQTSIYHGFLKAKPYGFTAKAGNFELADGDPLLLNALDGANSGPNGLPDADHIDNANMGTPPDGTSPTMQMYLFHFPGTTDAEEPFVPSSSSFDPSVILHEYTHGLSNRLVVDADGNSTLNDLQAGSMGEAWSDFYAMNFLVHRKLQADTKTVGDVKLGRYIDPELLIRTEPLDCPVGTKSSKCTNPYTGKRGGYTYGQLSTIIGEPEVHASGEIWAQTLWDLRKAMGYAPTASVVTRAMELSPNDPSFLDMRNAILQADLAVYGGKHRETIWKVFAHRGMGYFAGTINSADTNPAQSFARPPRPSAERAPLVGVVTDLATGEPLGGVTVTVGGLASGFPGALTTTTNASGQYVFNSVFLGRYPKVSAIAGNGYEVKTKAITVRSGGTRVDFSVRRDWAAASGGGAIAAFNGPDLSAYGCGPDGAIDLSQSTGWGSTTGDDLGTPTNVFQPKAIVVALPTSVSVTGFGVNPSATCGDAGSASTGDYRIEVSTNGTTWTTVQSGAFDESDRKMNTLSLGAAVDASYVRFTILSNQTPDFATNCPDGAFDGCSYSDLTELAVYGSSNDNP